VDVKIGGNDFQSACITCTARASSGSRTARGEALPADADTAPAGELRPRCVFYHARFAAAVIARGITKRPRRGDPRDAVFPSLHQIRRARCTSPIAWATIPSLFVKHFPRGLAGVHPPEALPSKTRQAILSGARAYGIHISRRLTLLLPVDDEGSN
jgi:hypothetical protein